MKQYIISVTAAAVICSLLTILIPKGRLNKLINKVISLFCTLVVLVPVLSYITSKSGNFLDFSTSKSEQVDYNYAYAQARLDYIAERLTIAANLCCDGVCEVAVDYTFTADATPIVNGITVRVSGNKPPTEQERNKIIDEIIEQLGVYCTNAANVSVKIELKE